MDDRRGMPRVGEGSTNSARLRIRADVVDSKTSDIFGTDIEASVGRFFFVQWILTAIGADRMYFHQMVQSFS